MRDVDEVMRIKNEIAIKRAIKLDAQQ